MLPSTAPSGADPDSHHHSCLQLLTHWHLHHRGSYRPDQDLHLWVFKGRGSSTCSAQICLCYDAWRRWQHKLTISRSGRTRPGAPRWAWGSSEMSLAEAVGHIMSNDFSVYLLFGVFSPSGWWDRWGQRWFNCVQLQDRDLRNHQWHHSHHHYHSHLKGQQDISCSCLFHFHFYLIWLSHIYIIFFFPLPGSERWIRESCGEEDRHNCRLWYRPR